MLLLEVINVVIETVIDNVIGGVDVVIAIDQ